MRTTALMPLLALAWLVGSAGAADPEAREPVPLISPRALLDRVQSGEPTVFLDVREPEEFAEDHIPGAINIPQREFEARQDEIPRDALVIPYCNMDFRGFVAVRELEALGFEEVALMQERGILGWQAQGLPIAGARSGLTDAEARERLETVPVETLLGDRLAEPVAPTGVSHEIEMEVSEWYFHPNDLRVEAGDELQITLTSIRGTHFFILPDFEVFAEIPEGKTREVAFVANRPGEYRFGSCEWDGAELQVMKGRLRVQDPSEAEGEK